MNEKSMEMEDKSKQRRLRKEKKQKEKKVKVREKTFWQIVWSGVLVFLKIIWKIIKFILKYILFPFWITGVLLVKWYKFLRFRSDDPLSKEDRNFLSLIPHTFFMIGITIVLFYLLFYLDVFEDTKNLIDPGFWASIGSWFVDLGQGIGWLLNQIFVIFLWGMIVEPFSEILSSHQWVSAAVLLAVVIVGGGLLILLYNLIKKGKLIIWLKKVSRGLTDWVKSTHQKVKDFILKYLIGEKYVNLRSKNFFWTNVLFQLIVTVVFFVFAIYMGIQKYFNDPGAPWGEGDVLRFAAYAAAILFVGVGIFATWFFTLVHGVSSDPPEKTE
ncbi:MAG: hypothetical protein GPJ51_03125 [Candidatus Heimdallarchaeota archaeon]|nr:hypothetical protein [Candidatus Heimdallarchaeota archaeon]